MFGHITACKGIERLVVPHLCSYEPWQTPEIYNFLLQMWATLGPKSCLQDIGQAWSALGGENFLIAAHGLLCPAQGSAWLLGPSFWDHKWARKLQITSQVYCHWTAHAISSNIERGISTRALKLLNQALQSCNLKFCPLIWHAQSICDIDKAYRCLPIWAMGQCSGKCTCHHTKDSRRSCF